MLRRFLDFQLSLTEPGKPLHRMRPLVAALDTFLYEAPNKTKGAPHIRDAVDLKRWMIIVFFALLPCILMAIWNAGIQKFVYASGNYKLMNEFIASCHSLSDYVHFALKDSRYLTILKLGAMAFFPIVVISYAVGGLCEGIFACVRNHEIAEGFLVTGILYALILPPTIPYWMAAVGVAAGVILSKELFGGTGMNIMNPALCCRAFVFFTFPGQMSGDVWVGTNPTTIRESLIAMNHEAGLGPLDGYTQATPLAKFNMGLEIKRVHVDAIATNLKDVAQDISTMPVIQKQFEKWSSISNAQTSLGSLVPEQLKDFVTSSIDAGGLGLSPDNYDNAYRFAGLQYEQGIQTDWNFFFGNKLGSFGEISVFACLLGALFLVYTRVGAWRTMVGMVLGAYCTALAFQLIACNTGVDGGAWNPAILAFPAYKHLLLGGLAFGVVFMATDPVSSASIKLSKWVYGFLIGMIAIFIRAINPAYPEGVMLAILAGNVFAPLIDHYVAASYRRRVYGIK
ncbi:MAG: nqrB [Chlamydiia bacterium]|nr:nqrB [Chlamydiia bacterium]